MKKISALFIAVAIAFSAQSQILDSLTLSKLRLNFAVPDMPAFKSLGTEPSNLLRPSTIRAFAVTTSEFYQDRRIVLPEAFAVEVSPAMLINAHKGRSGLSELKEYARKAVINSFRISIGTSNDALLSPSGRSLAIGTRISLINKGDLTTDTTYQLKISGALKTFRENVRKNSITEFAILRGLDTTGVDWDTIIATGGRLKADFDLYLANEEEQSQKAFLEEFNKLKEEYRTENWNATKLDLAAAVLSSSPDSLVKNIKFNNLQFWLTYAGKAGKNGQLLIGLNSQLYKNLLDQVPTTKNNSYFSLSIPVRYFMGTNKVKGFAEAQYSYQGELKENKFLFNLGTELNIVDGVWVNLYAGLDFNSTAGATVFKSNLDLRLTLPENFKFF